MINSKTPRAEKAGAGVYGPVIALAVGVLAVLSLVVSVMVNQFDDVALSMQTQTAERGYRNRLTNFAAMVQPRLESGDALRHLTGTFDPAWVESNLARYFLDRNNITRLIVVDGRNRPVFFAVDGHRVDPGAISPAYAAAMAGLLSQTRIAEATIPASKVDALPAPIQFTNILFSDNQLYIMTSTLVRARAGAVGAPVVVTMAPVDHSVLSIFGVGKMVNNFRVTTDLNTDSKTAVLPLQDLSGKVVAGLAWDRRNPGSDLLVRLMWPMVAMLLLLLLLGASLARQTHRYARGLILSEARARHLAFHDTLTQLPNRALMFERLNQLRSLARRSGMDVAVLCLDLDRFKEVNDTLGHPAGDTLIRAAARRLSDMLRETDTVARLGGDEFVILQPHSGAAGAAHLSERIINAFSRPFDIDGQMVEIGCSIGITIINDPEISASEVLRQADLALYCSKEKGRNRATFFETEMDVALRVRRQLEMDLREALNEDMLHMVYQPQVDAYGRMRGVEALVRWNHPEKGLIPPNAFVVLAEESGLIAQLGAFIVGRVFAETRNWHGVPVAINVSALQLRTPNFMTMISRLVAEHAIDPRQYEFEITETVLLGDDAATRDNIATLKQEGFAIALDDFGTGYSSLSSLQRFAVDRIKIDRAFVRNLDDEDEDAVRLIQAIIQLAQALDLDVIAEGVETEGQRARLLQCGCDQFQGFLFSRPISAEAVAQLIETPAPLGPVYPPSVVASSGQARA
ncbi:putative bifunctional diguanylate cyclase/phosphodiesterase [Novosphingobium sp. KACC 22771]|uniref:putative bifunctional diguanylate cyclase/phosphodiesterase n=1 Tax=Novosphingobium sp. KACC 22771 TaxID=3025670 RepID=UPI00236634D2|nr:EAL domain-containing protein [Novosphingobium sp. KACC 22771]WDF71443.1 EAL domain-containing protein [Novosphingobium sp. KACC 22771]